MKFVEFVATALLVGEASACLLLARWCWRQGAKGELSFRVSARAAAILFTAAAAVIVYGLNR